MHSQDDQIVAVVRISNESEASPGKSKCSRPRTQRKKKNLHIFLLSFLLLSYRRTDVLSPQNWQDQKSTCLSSFLPTVQFCFQIFMPFSIFQLSSGEIILHDDVASTTTTVPPSNLSSTSTSASSTDKTISHKDNLIPTVSSFEQSDIHSYLEGIEPSVSSDKGEPADVPTSSISSTKQKLVSPTPDNEKSVRPQQEQEYINMMHGDDPAVRNAIAGNQCDHTNCDQKKNSRLDEPRAEAFRGVHREEYPDFFDDYWNDVNSPQLKRELSMLLDYPENRHIAQQLTGAHSEVTYPVQIERTGKTPGISTRDANKISLGESRSYYQQSHHVHRTSYRIKAFSHVFNVELELNSNLLTERMRAVHRNRDGKTQIDDQIEHCYYHGTVKDYSGAIAAFRTCNGLAGIIQLGNETLIVAPIAGGENLARHPHYVMESSKASLHIPQKCGVASSDSWSSGAGFDSRAHGRKRKNVRHRFTRDITTTTKYIETALFLDKRFMELREHNRQRAMHDALQIANIADLYLKTINTRLTITYLETWSGRNLVMLDKRLPIFNSLKLFSEHVGQHHINDPKDTSHLITGEQFDSDESGTSTENSICTDKSAGISVDLNMYEPHLVASTFTHMIGHNLHMTHDEGRDCSCVDWYGCIMARSIVGKDHVQPSKFSKCSQDDYYKALHSNPHLNCILKQHNTRSREPIQSNGLGSSMNKLWPINQSNNPLQRGYPKCGNGRVEEGEQCDCGSVAECQDIDPCCDPRTCKRALHAECSKGPCCDSNCALRSKGTPCRKARSECDIPEFCDGLHGTCPIDIFKKTGTKCEGGRGYCFKGICPTRDTQCSNIWGLSGKSSNESCYNKLNTQGVFTGNCGRRRDGSYIRCAIENAMCGKLFCQDGMKMPVVSSHNDSYFKASFNIHGKELECKVLNYDDSRMGGEDYSITQDGTACGENLVCINQTCTSIYVHIEHGRCMSNDNEKECSGNGVCSSINTCYCNPGWVGEDCSSYDASHTTNYPTNSFAFTTASSEEAEDAKNTTTERTVHNGKGPPSSMCSQKTCEVSLSQQGSNTVFLVVVLVSTVGAVFFFFAFMALCYRRKSTLPKYDDSYLKRPIVKKPPQQHLNPMMGKGTEETNLDMVNKNITFGPMPSYSVDNSTRSTPGSGVGPIPPGMDLSRELKMPMMKRGPCEEDPLQSGDDEMMTFMDMSGNIITSKIPEKGILKKPFEKWSEESQSDNNDVMSQNEQIIGDPECQVSEVERTLKSLNGYHEDIIDALKRAASNRTTNVVGAASLSSDEISTAQHVPYPRFATPDLSRLKSSHEKLIVDSGEEEDDQHPPHPIRIRNLEDLIRQLEHHPSRHVSPSCSEEIRMSEPEAERHYRLDNASCTESQGRVRGDSTGSLGFVYGRYRQPTSSASGSTSGGRGSETRLVASNAGGLEFSDGGDSQGNYTEEDDLDRNDGDDHPDSESDDYLDGSRSRGGGSSSNTLLRSASEEALPSRRYHQHVSASQPRLYSPPSDTASFPGDTPIHQLHGLPPIIGGTVPRQRAGPPPPLLPILPPVRGYPEYKH